MNFYTGILVGVLGVYAFHRFVSPIPGKSAAGSRG